MLATLLLSDRQFVGRDTTGPVGRFGMMDNAFANAQVKP